MLNMYAKRITYYLGTERTRELEQRVIDQEAEMKRNTAAAAASKAAVSCDNCHITNGHISNCHMRNCFCHSYWLIVLYCMMRN
jgi:hypothetical protein